VRLPEPSPVFAAYWRFAAERQRMYLRRAAGEAGPWTADPVLTGYRFTNAYRVLDRVTQTLLRDVIAPGPHAPADLVVRVLLYKLFNRPATWHHLVDSVGQPCGGSFGAGQIISALDHYRATGAKLYSNAYVMPPVPSAPGPKHHGHVRLLERMLDDGLPERVAADGTLDGTYRLLLAYPGLGPFLAFQFAIDLNYTSITATDEDDVIVPGPGALDGISKCFPGARRISPADLIVFLARTQDDWFGRHGLCFSRIAGRPLQPIDIQNLFCEISKYARVAFPDVRGSAGRLRIKQRFSAAGPLMPMILPEKWSSSPRRDAAIA
jgi:hypothetical protein